MATDERNDESIFKVHDLALLVSNVHELKLFYTFLNYLRRSSQVDDKDWHRYISKALKETAMTTDSMNHDDRTIFGQVTNQCRRDGVKLDACTVQHSVSGSSSSKTWSSEVDFRKQRYSSWSHSSSIKWSIMSMQRKKIGLKRP